MHNQMHSHVANAQASRNGSLAFAALRSGSNGSHYFWSQLFGVPVFRHGMPNICGVVNPLKIFSLIVDRVKISMVHIRKMCGVWHKGHGYYAVNHSGLLNAISAQNDMFVAGSFVGRGSQKFSFAKRGACSFVGNKPVHASQSSVVGDFVQSFKARDWFPDFIVHSGKYSRKLTMMQLARGGM